MRRATTLSLGAPIALALAASLAALVSCGPNPYYGTSTVTEQGGDPSAVINPDLAIQIAEGSAANANIVFNSLTGGTMSGDIQSRDPSILTILHTPHDGNVYVFLGRKAGLAEVILSTNGSEVRSLNAVVTAPPASDELFDAGAIVVDGGADAGDAGSVSDAGDAGSVSDAGDAGDAAVEGDDAGAADSASDGGGESEAGDAASDG
jgi:hypothetical protein